MLVFNFVAGEFTCNYCEGSFTTAEFFQQHETSCKSNIPEPSTSNDDESTVIEMLNNDGYCEVKDKQHKCTYFDEEFSTVQTSDTHILTDTGEKQYKCTQCHKTFQYSIVPSENCDMILETGQSMKKEIENEQFDIVLNDSACTDRSVTEEEYNQQLHSMNQEIKIEIVEANMKNECFSNKGIYWLNVVKVTVNVIIG